MSKAWSTSNSPAIRTTASSYKPTQSSSSPAPGVYNLTLTIQYSGLKATQYFSKYSEEAVDQLREDLRVLGFPKPSVANIKFVSYGCFQAFWVKSVPSPLHSVLKATVRRSKSMQSNNGVSKVKKMAELNIDWITLDEIPLEEAQNNNSHTNASNVPPSRNGTSANTTTTTTTSSSWVGNGHGHGHGKNANAEPSSSGSSRSVLPPSTPATMHTSSRASQLQSCNNTMATTTSSSSSSPAVAASSISTSTPFVSSSFITAGTSGSNFGQQQQQQQYQKHRWDPVSAFIQDTLRSGVVPPAAAAAVSAPATPNPIPSTGAGAGAGAGAVSSSSSIRFIPYTHTNSVYQLPPLRPVPPPTPPTPKFQTPQTPQTTTTSMMTRQLRSSTNAKGKGKAREAAEVMMGTTAPQQQHIRTRSASAKKGQQQQQGAKNKNRNNKNNNNNNNNSGSNGNVATGPNSITVTTRLRGANTTRQSSGGSGSVVAAGTSRLDSSAASASSSGASTGSRNISSTSTSGVSTASRGASRAKSTSASTSTSTSNTTTMTSSSSMQLRPRTNAGVWKRYPGLVSPRTLRQRQQEEEEQQQQAGQLNRPSLVSPSKSPSKPPVNESEDEEDEDNEEGAEVDGDHVGEEEERLERRKKGRRRKRMSHKRASASVNGNRSESSPQSTKSRTGTGTGTGMGRRVTCVTDDGEVVIIGQKRASEPVLVDSDEGGSERKRIKLVQEEEGKEEEKEEEEQGHEEGKMKVEEVEQGEKDDKGDDEEHKVVMTNVDQEEKDDEKEEESAGTATSTAVETEKEVEGLLVPSGSTQSSPIGEVFVGAMEVVMGEVGEEEEGEASEVSEKEAEEGECASDEVEIVNEMIVEDVHQGESSSEDNASLEMVGESDDVEIVEAEGDHVKGVVVVAAASPVPVPVVVEQSSGNEVEVCVGNVGVQTLEGDVEMKTVEEAGVQTEVVVVDRQVSDAFTQVEPGDVPEVELPPLKERDNRATVLANTNDGDVVMENEVVVEATPRQSLSPEEVKNGGSDLGTDAKDRMQRQLASELRLARIQLAQLMHRELALVAEMEKTKGGTSNGITVQEKEENSNEGVMMKQLLLGWEQRAKQAEADIEIERKMRVDVVNELGIELRRREAVESTLREHEGQLKAGLRMERLRVEQAEGIVRRDRARVEELERELGIERKRREEVECMLEDVERECRAPFVVPALLEAFKVVSGVTSKVLDESLPLPAV